MNKTLIDGWSLLARTERCSFVIFDAVVYTNGRSCIACLYRKHYTDFAPCTQPVQSDNPKMREIYVKPRALLVMYCVVVHQHLEQNSRTMSQSKNLQGIRSILLITKT